jgi:hypothetical protein
MLSGMNHLFSQSNLNEDFPYQLVLKNSQNGNLLRGGYACDGEIYGFSLIRKETQKQWDSRSYFIYVFSIDAMKTGNCFFPRSPLDIYNIKIDDKGPAEIELGPKKLFRITAPYGKDSYIMVASELPIPYLQCSDIPDIIEEAQADKQKNVYVDVVVVQSLASSPAENSKQDIPVLLTAIPEPDSRGIVVSQSPFRFFGFAQATGGIKQISVNGQPAEIKMVNMQNFKWEKKLNLQNGNNKIVISATSLNGDSVNDSLTVFYDSRRGSASLEDEAGASVREGTDKVLFIATDIYDSWGNLKNPVLDAQAISRDLDETYGFSIDTVFNPTKNEIVKVLKKYITQDFKPDDQLMIFISGHGYFDEVMKEGFIVTRDSKVDDEFKESYIAHSSLMRMMNNIPCNHILVVLDVCYAGTFDDYVASNKGIDLYAEKGRDSFITDKLKYKTRIFLASTRKTQVSDGVPGEHSPFARKFLEALRTKGGADKILTMSEIMSVMDKLPSNPLKGEFKGNEPGSDFLLIVK